MLKPARISNKETHAGKFYFLITKDLFAQLDFRLFDVFLHARIFFIKVHKA